MPNKFDCEEHFHNLRVHYSDVRSFLLKDKETPQFLTMFLEQIESQVINDDDYEEEFYENQKLILSLEPDMFNQIVDSYFKDSSQEEFNKIFDKSKLPSILSENDWLWEESAELSTNGEYLKRLKKQLDNISDSTIKNKLLLFYKNEINKLKKRYRENWSLIKEIDDSPWLLELNYFNNFAPVIFDTTILINDIYVIARIFKDSLKNGREVWIYYGDAHIQNINNFLSNYLNKKMDVTSYDENKCLPLPKESNVFNRKT